jgi:DTW domain-containing protein YfiP
MALRVPERSAGETASRLMCARCQRPQRACICRWVRPVDNQVELLLLQHPLEQHQAKGTAGLLLLSLSRHHCLVGEQFEPALLARALATPDPSFVNLLLYPDDAAGWQQAAPALTADALARPERLRLVVLDATWRKSRKMLHLNPLLQALPRWALQQPPASRYTIRRAQQVHQLSTLEATVLALQQLEGASRVASYAPLLTAFDGFVAQLTPGLNPANQRPAPRR